MPHGGLTLPLHAKLVFTLCSSRSSNGALNSCLLLKHFIHVTFILFIFFPLLQLCQSFFLIRKVFHLWLCDIYFAIRLFLKILHLGTLSLFSPKAFNSLRDFPVIPRRIYHSLILYLPIYSQYPLLKKKKRRSNQNYDSLGQHVIFLEAKPKQHNHTCNATLLSLFTNVLSNSCRGD